RRRHTRFSRDWSSDVCSSDLHTHETWLILLDDACIRRNRHLTGGEGVQCVNRDIGRNPRRQMDDDLYVLRCVVLNTLYFDLAFRSEERRVGKEWRCREVLEM